MPSWTAKGIDLLSAGMTTMRTMDATIPIILRAIIGIQSIVTILVTWALPLTHPHPVIVVKKHTVAETAEHSNAMAHLHIEPPNPQRAAGVIGLRIPATAGMLILVADAVRAGTKDMAAAGGMKKSVM